LGNPRSNTMARGEAMTPVPEGIITTTTTWSEPQEVVEEVTPVIEEEKIPWEEVKKDLGIQNDLPTM